MSSQVNAVFDCVKLFAKLKLQEGRKNKTWKSFSCQRFSKYDKELNLKQFHIIMIYGQLGFYIMIFIHLKKGSPL